MIVELFTEPEVRRPFEKAFRPASDAEHRDDQANGSSEERIVFCGVSWEQYARLDKELGQDRPGPRLYWHDRQLEIMTTSLRHEQIKKGLATLLEDYLFDASIAAFPHGQATLKRMSEAGAEPDESWCFGEDKELPELVIEIALRSGGIPKLEIYQQFAVPEVWLWRKDAMEIWTLRADQSGYEGSARKSRLLPKLDIELLERCLALPGWREARIAFRKGLKPTAG